MFQRYQISLVLLAAAVAVGIGTLGCAEKPAAQPSASNGTTPVCNQNSGFGTGQQFGNGQQQASGSQSGVQLNPNCPPTGGQPILGSGSGDQVPGDLCATLQGNQNLANSYAIFIGALCGSTGTLNLLRTGQYLYKGNGTPVLKVDDKVSTVTRDDGLDRSEMQAYGAFATPATPLSYFQLMQMKIDQPNQFKNTYPDTHYDGKNVTYTKISGSVQTGVRYRYTNVSSGSDTGDVDYEATARFITLIEGQTYVVATDFELKHDMVDAMRGLSIINKYNGVTEVISVSDQIFENGGNANHDKAVADARGSLERDLNYSFRQALYKHQNIDGGQ